MSLRVGEDKGFALASGVLAAPYAFILQSVVTREKFRLVVADIVHRHSKTQFTGSCGAALSFISCIDWFGWAHWAHELYCHCDSNLELFYQSASIGDAEAANDSRWPCPP